MCLTAETFFNGITHGKGPLYVPHFIENIFEMEIKFAKVILCLTVVKIYIMDYAVSDTVYYSVLSGSSVELDGCRDQKRDTQYNLYWKFEDNILFHDNFLLYTEFSETASLVQDKSLVLNPVSPMHAGPYQCLIDSSVMITYVVSVKGMYGMYV